MSDEETTPAQPAQQAVQVVQMAQSVTIQPMPEFRPDAKVGASLATRWINWQSDFEMFLTASGITDAKRKRALLLYQAGPRVREIFKQLTDTGNDDDYEVAKAKLKEYFDPQKNRRYEVYRFRQAMQNPDETLDEYHTRLRTMSATCEFNDVEFEIEQQIIIGGTSSKIRKRALRDPKFDLKSMLLEGRRDEQSSYYITLHTLLTFPTGFFNDNLHQIKLFKTNASNNLKVIYKLDRREKLYVLFTVVIYKVSNIVFLLRILI